MAIQSYLFERLVDHAPFVMIGWSIWLTLLQKKYFPKDFYKEKLLFLNLSNRISKISPGIKKAPYQRRAYCMCAISCCLFVY